MRASSVAGVRHACRRVRAAAARSYPPLRPGSGCFIITSDDVHTAADAVLFQHTCSLSCSPRHLSLWPAHSLTHLPHSAALCAALRAGALMTAPIPRDQGPRRSTTHHTARADGCAAFYRFSQVCQDCRRPTELVEDRAAGDLICKARSPALLASTRDAARLRHARALADAAVAAQECGRVLESHCIEESSEWRSFSDSARARRCTSDAHAARATDRRADASLSPVCAGQGEPQRP